MIASVTIEGFRGLASVELEGLRAVNLVVGPNNAGKTSLLEALHVFVAAHAPGLLVQLLSNVRRYSAPTVEDIWSAYARNPSDVVRIAGVKDAIARTLVIERVASDGVMISATDPENLGSRVLAERTTSLIRSTYSRGDDESIYELVATPNGLSQHRVAGSLPPVAGKAVFIAAQAADPGRDLAWLSALLKEGGEERVLRHLRTIEPDLARIFVVSTGQVAEIWAELGSGRRLPFALMGDGMRHFLSLSLALTAVPGGVLFKDEIENGVFHRNLPALWSMLREGVRATGSQAFVTTHSYECVEAAAHAFRDSNDLALIHLERRGDEIVARAQPASVVVAAVESGFEVR